MVTPYLQWMYEVTNMITFKTGKIVFKKLVLRIKVEILQALRFVI